ncbi:MAG: hypothetical protein L0099_06085, partial [Acidobacteria bacterium]|nr:hypothetical protein [Acidobacteriota bacterium]
PSRSPGEFRQGIPPFPEGEGIHFAGAVNLKGKALLSLKTGFYTELERKARSCMTPIIDEAKHRLRIALSPSHLGNSAA